ncbi:MAG: ankyrin repeat domain-containing protein [Woeseiaceae bacterium]|nr:ankyrin repeat domain-containing protein [Woeseiaceae bacterium]
MVRIPTVEPRTTEQDVRLIEAALYGKVEKVRQLIAEGVEVDSIDANGHTALIFAAMAGKADVVRELLKNGADSTIKDSVGHDAFTAAMFFGDFRGMTVPPYDEILKMIKNSRSR